MQCESRQIRIGPLVRPCHNPLTRSTPLLTEMGAFRKKDYPVIKAELAIDMPCFSRRQNIFLHNMRVCKQPEKSELTDAAESDLVPVNGLQPLFRPGVMNVPVGCQRNPDIHIR